MGGTVPPGSLSGVAELEAGVRPITLKVLAGLLWGKAVALAGLTGWLLYRDLAGDADRQDLATFVTVYSGAYAALLAFVGFAVWRRKSWSRGPAMLLELFLLALGYYMIRGGQPVLGVAVILLGLLGVAMVVAAPTRRALGLDFHRSERT